MRSELLIGPNLTIPHDLRVERSHHSSPTHSGRRVSKTAEHHRSPAVEDPVNTVDLSAVIRRSPAFRGLGSRLTVSVTPLPVDSSG